MNKSWQFKKGYAPWNKGKKLSDEHIRNLSTSHKGQKSWAKGKKLTLEHRKKLSLAKIGKRKVNPISCEDKLQRIRFRREILKLVFERDNYTCQICGIKGKAIQVDHIQPWSEYIELRFDINNCRTLCMDCHYKITFGKPKPLSIKTWGHNLKQVERTVV